MGGDLRDLMPNEEQSLQGKYFGKYMGWCRDNNDPERRYRIRCEVPFPLGKGEAKWSEWAFPCFQSGGSKDQGSPDVPLEGAGVWVEFQGGDPRYPIWVGVWYDGVNPCSGPLESVRLCNGRTCIDCEDKRDHQDDPYHLKYQGHPPYSCNRRPMLFKSETGATIYADDRDEEEFLRIIDRAGMTLEFSSPVLREENVGNAQQRGERTALDGTQISLSKLKDQTAFIRMLDLTRQLLEFRAKTDEERITIRSNDVNLGRIQFVEIDTKKGREKITISGLNGTQTLVIDCTDGLERIVWTDAAGQTIVMDARAGQEKIRLTDKANNVVEMSAIPGQEKITLTDKLGQQVAVQAGPSPQIKAQDVAGSMVVLDGTSGTVVVKPATLALIG